MAQKMAKANQSVEKALQLVEVLAQAREPMRLQDVAEAAGLPPSTALRMLHTLILCGYANQDPMTLRYGLTLKFAYIGSLISARLEVRNLAHPLLLELSLVHILQAQMDAVCEDEANLPGVLGSDGTMPQCSMVIIDQKTGEIKALYGGRGEKTGNLVLNRATRTYRSPGSSIKPVSVYAPALEYGYITPTSVLDDVPKDFNISSSGWPKTPPTAEYGRAA